MHSATPDTDFSRFASFASFVSFVLADDLTSVTADLADNLADASAGNRQDSLQDNQQHTSHPFRRRYSR